VDRAGGGKPGEEVHNNLEGLFSTYLGEVISFFIFS
jgi:hypothetical protein